MKRVRLFLIIHIFFASSLVGIAQRMPSNSISPASPQRVAKDVKEANTKVQKVIEKKEKEKEKSIANGAVTEPKIVTSASGEVVKAKPSFEVLYDEPYAINQLFIGFQPFYLELFATNVNAGYGLDLHYYYQNKFDVKANIRKTYSGRFYDFNRELARLNSGVSNVPEVFNYYELTGTYHIKDFDANTKSKFVLRKKSGNSWATEVPEKMEIPGKMRQIYGARLGTIIWNSTIDVNRIIENQGLTFADMPDAEGNILPNSYIAEDGRTREMKAFTNLYTANIFVGGSFSMIRNIAVDFEGYDDTVDDNLLTLYLDIMYAPFNRLDPILYNGSEYATDRIKLSSIGVRAGLDGKFNRKLSWGYGGEFGFRPGLSGRGFFAMMRLALPMYCPELRKKSN